MTQFVVGLTGGIGSGKSTVAKLFEQQGIAIVDADVVARQVVIPGSTGLQALLQQFGPGILQNNGQLDRAALRQLVFDNADARLKLNQIIHPLIRAELLLQLQQAHSRYVILVAPLLIENELNALVDQVLVVDVAEQTQIDRTSQRDQVQGQQVAAIMAVQCSRPTRLAAANQTINNDGDPNLLPEKVLQLHQLYIAMAAEKLAKTLT